MQKFRKKSRKKLHVTYKIIKIDLEIHEGLQTCTSKIKHGKHCQLKVCQKIIPFYVIRCYKKA